MNSFMLGITSSILGGLAILIAQKLIHFISEKRALLTGIWEAHVFNEEGKIIKRDRIDMKQQGEKIYGNIRRLDPAKENYRKFKFIGRSHGGKLIAIFWPINSLVRDDGCAYLRLKADFHFEGFYMNFHESSDQNIRLIRGEIVKRAKNLL